MDLRHDRRGELGIGEMSRQESQHRRRERVGREALLQQHGDEPFGVVTAAGFLAMLIITVGLVAGGVVRFVMIPEVPGDFVQASLEMVEGTPEAETRRAFEHMDESLRIVDEAYAAEHEGDENRRLVSHVAAFGNGGRHVTFMAELTKNEMRDIDGAEIARRWREQIGEIPGAKILAVSIADQQMGAAISLKLSSSHAEDLAAAPTSPGDASRGVAEAQDDEGDGLG